MKNKQNKIVTCFVFLFLSTPFFSQESEKKLHIDVYPSVNVSYGAGFYKISIDRGGPLRSFNENLSVSTLVNAHFKFKNELSFEFYGGYNWWTHANLFPIGIIVKPNIGRKAKEFYLKMGGGYTFGECADPKLSPSYVKIGEPKYHLKLGVEKKWLIFKKNAISFGVDYLWQNVYYKVRNGGYSYRTAVPELSANYKFLGITLGYHFY